MNKISADSIHQLKKIRNDWLNTDKKFGDGTKKEYQYSFQGLNILLVFSEHLQKKHTDPLIPSRINISTENLKIKEIFHSYLMMQLPHKNLKTELWVFRNNPYVNYKSFQYELRFFPNEETLRRQLSKEEEEYQLIEEFTMVEEEKSYYNEIVDICFDLFSQLSLK